MGHIQDTIKEVTGATMPFKDFITQHITAYWPCVFREAVVSWPALTLWANRTVLSEKLGSANLEVS